MRHPLLLLLVLPGMLFAEAPELRIPAGMLLARSEDAVYAASPDSSLLLETGLLSFYPAGESPIWPEIEVPRSVQQGKVFAVEVAVGDALTELTATVQSAMGKPVTSGRGFEVPAPAQGAGEPPPPHVYVVLLGIPTDGTAVPCVLGLRGSMGSRGFSYARPLDVMPIVVQETRVVLDTALTALRTRVDERTARDQKRLNQAVFSFSPSAVHDLEAFRVPLTGAVQSAGFGDKRVYQYAGGQTAQTIHRGLDLAVDSGTPVGSCARGRVLLAEEMVVTGNTMAIEHLPGLVSFYFHLSSFAVAEGNMVEPGQTIGTVGATGLATGPHLHWELRCGGVPVEPISACEASVVDKSALVRIITAYRNQSQRR